MSEVLDLLDEYQVLREDRKFFEETWQDIVDNLLPNLAGFTTDPPIKGQRGDEAIREGTPRFALATFQAGLMGRLMSATSDWFGFEAPDEDLMDDRDIRMWLSKASQVVFGLINSSPFYSEVYKLFGIAGGLGTATMYRYFDPRFGRAMFTLRNPREIYLADNESGENDTVFRATWMTARQMVSAFEDDTLDPAVLEAAESATQQHNEFQVIHAVKPNPAWEPGKRDKRVKRFSSWYIDVDHTSEIRKGGYSVMPYSTWAIEKEVNESYGRGPGWRALPDVKALYAYASTDITAAQMITNPPLEIPEERRGNVKWIPGGRNYYEDAGRRIFTPEQHVDLRAGLDREQRKQQIIERHFMVPFFTAMQQIGGMDRERTAYEVRQIEQEMAILLGPYSMGFQSQFMDSVAGGLLYDALDNNLLAPPPEKLIQGLRGRKLENIYSGPLAQAQKAFFNTEPYRRTIQDIQALMSVDPTGQSLPRQILDIPDWDKFLKEMAQGNGLPEEAMLEMRKVTANRQARAKDMERQKRLAAMEQMGKAMPGLGSPVAPGSAADVLGKQAQGQAVAARQ